MRIIKSDDFYVVKVVGYVSNIQLRVFEVLYLPFIGIPASSVYKTLLLTKDYRGGDLINHEFLTTQLNLSYNQLTRAFSILEAVGLIQTYLIKHKAFNEYTYYVNAPKDPAMFSKDQIFMALLEGIVGPKTSQDLLNLFTLEKFDAKGEEVTTDFMTVFANEFDKMGSKSKTTTQPIINHVGRIETDFDQTLFHNYLAKERYILPSALSKQELSDIRQIATLYNLSEQAIAAKVGEFYNSEAPFGMRLNMKILTEDLRELIKYPEIIKPLTKRRIQKVSGKSKEIALINKMEQMNPFDFLTMLNNGTKIAFRDQEIIELLSIEYRLNNAVINALLSFSLETFNNALPKAAIEKYASSLVRKKVETALDTLDALKAPIYKKPRKTKTKDEEKSVSTPQTKEENKQIWDELKNL